MFADLINQCLEEPIERFIKQEQARESALLECEERLEISVDIWKVCFVAFHTSQTFISCHLLVFNFERIHCHVSGFLFFIYGFE